MSQGGLVDTGSEGVVVVAMGVGFGGNRGDQRRGGASMGGGGEQHEEVGDMHGMEQGEEGWG